MVCTILRWRGLTSRERGPTRGKRTEAYLACSSRLLPSLARSCAAVAGAASTIDIAQAGMVLKPGGGRGCRRRPPWCRAFLSAPDRRFCVASDRSFTLFRSFWLRAHVSDSGIGRGPGVLSYALACPCALLSAVWRQSMPTFGDGRPSPSRFRTFHTCSTGRVQQLGNVAKMNREGAPFVWWLRAEFVRMSFWAKHAVNGFA